MRNLLYSKKARYLAVCLSVLCAVLSVLSAFLLYLTVSLNIYDKPWSEVESDCYERVQSIYSMKIFEQMQEYDNAACLNGTNLEYGILDVTKYQQLDASKEEQSDAQENQQPDVSEEEQSEEASAQTDKEIARKIDFQNKDNYIYENFETDMPDENTYKCTFTDNTEVVYSEQGLKSLLDGGYTYECAEDGDEEARTYWIVSRVKEPLDATVNDLFTQQMKWLSFLYHARYILIVVCLVSGVICLGAIAFSVANITKQAKRERLKEDREVWYQMPLAVYLAIMGGLFYFTCLLGYEGMEYLQDCAFGRGLFAMLGVVCALAAGGWLLEMTFLNLLYRFSAKILWKNTVTYHLADMVKKIVKIFRQNTTLVLRGAVVLALISLAELFVIVITDCRLDLEISCFFLYKIPETVVILLVLLQMKKLQDSSRQMAQGDLETKIDTKNMFWEFKTHAEYLNQIRDGMTIAVQEKMKSERFKTELITNVSHDIKTPLTSIINYIDLMKREEIDNATVREYLEVAERHSIKLKKLTEDLVEASKASTGNLKVNWEECDVDILLTQTLGEFEEKLNEADLELIIAKQQETGYIMADNRHLWRIFDNLMSNICKYAQPGTRVYINQETTQDMVNIVFRNTSKYPLNITSEELMERFVRGDASRNTEGSGLGLSIARNLAEMMNGTLELYVDGDLFKVVLKFPRKLSNFQKG